jgi:hypothetical protein
MIQEAQCVCLFQITLGSLIVGVILLGVVVVSTIARIDMSPEADDD